MIENQDQQGKIAVLIDAENTNYKKVADIIQEVSFYGHIVTKRAYGNWNNCSRGWVEAIKDNAITPIQQFENTAKKNSSDIALVIDAMDLLYSKKYDTFVIVSSDSDFTRLVTRIHDDEIFVIGVGEQKTPQSLIKACDEFIYVENIETEQPEIIPETTKEKGTKDDKDTANEVKKLNSFAKSSLCSKLKKIAKTEKYTDDDGWVNIGAAGSILKRQDPSFDTRNYGYSSLVKLIEKELSKTFEINRRKNDRGKPVTVEYRIK